MYNTIIIPTDLSHQEQTIESLQKAEKLSSNGRIILLHVLEEVPTYALVGLSPEMLQDLTPKTLDTMNAMVVKSGVTAETEVRHGGAYRNIIESAKEHHASLIIINSHKPGLQDYLLGSTAAKVVRHSPCAVLVER